MSLDGGRGLQSRRPNLSCWRGSAGGEGSRGLESSPASPLASPAPPNLSSRKTEALAGLMAMPAFARHSRRTRVTRWVGKQDSPPRTPFHDGFPPKRFSELLFPDHTVSHRSWAFHTQFFLAGGSTSAGARGTLATRPVLVGLVTQGQQRAAGEPPEPPDRPAGLWAKRMLTVILLPAPGPRGCRVARR